MRVFRRAVVAMGLAALGVIVLRFRGSSGSPTQGGTWRELSGEDLR